MLIDSTPRLGRRLDAVVDGVLEQRLQHERRDERVARHALHVPVDDQPLAEPQLLELEVLPAQLDLVGERRQVAVVAHQHAKQVGQVLSAASARRGSLRTSDSTRGDAVEQEVRADARLQRLQPRLGDRRRQRASAQPEIGDQQRIDAASANAR